MKHERIEVQYNLDFNSAFYVGTGLPHGLIHRAIARDCNGFLYVPGSTLKGILRDRATYLAQLLDLKVYEPHNPEDVHEFAHRADITTRIFGSRFRPGTLFFDDARLSEEHRAFFKPDARNSRLMTKQVEMRTQVSLSRITGTAQHQMLFNTEYGIPTLRFEGRIYGRLSGVPIEGSRTTYSLVLLLAALGWLDGIGGNKSTGAGHVTCTVAHLYVDGTEVNTNDYLALLPEFEYYETAEEYAEEDGDG